MNFKSPISVNTETFFPCNITAFRNDTNPEKLNQSIIDYVNEESEKNPDNKKFSVGGKGWHSPINLTDLEYDWCFDLKSLILHASQAHKQGPIEKAFVECWAVKLEEGGYSNYHSHANFKYSGVYYVQTPGECSQTNGAISFPDPRGSHGTMNEMPTIAFVANAGEGLVFESWMPHYVTPYHGDESRISISWNIVFPDD